MIVKMYVKVPFYYEFIIECYCELLCYYECSCYYEFIRSVSITGSVRNGRMHLFAANFEIFRKKGVRFELSHRFSK